MDALMRARDTAARHTFAGAQNVHTSDARINAGRYDVLATAHRELDSAREALTAMRSKLDSAREQLSSLLAAAPMTESSRAAGDSRSPACAHSASVPSTAHQSRPFSACAMLSVLLIVAAFGAIIAIGTKQL
eukprot:2231959-Pleurochrysis_carterae.AAC.1